MQKPSVDCLLFMRHVILSLLFLLALPPLGLAASQRDQRIFNAEESGETPTPPEVHSFQIRGEITYRCYGGYGPQKDIDSRTKEVCDNKTITKTLINEAIKIKIEDEPTPDDSKDLAGDWSKEVEFKGRKFVVAITLFKTVPPQSEYPYRIRVVAEDDEPKTRQSAVITEADSVAHFNPIAIDYSSSGQPEEIHFSAFVTAADKQ